MLFVITICFVVIIKATIEKANMNFFCLNNTELQKYIIYLTYFTIHNIFVWLHRVSSNFTRHMN